MSDQDKAVDDDNFDATDSQDQDVQIQLGNNGDLGDLCQVIQEEDDELEVVNDTT